MSTDQRVTRVGWSAGILLVMVIFVALLSGRYDFTVILGNLPGDPRWLVLLLVVGPILIFVNNPKYPRKYQASWVPPTLFTAWVAWMILSGFWADYSSDVLGEVTSFVIMGAYYFLARSTAARVEVKQARILFAFVLIVAYLYLFAALASNSGGVGRLSAFGGGPNVFVRVQVLGALAAVALGVIHRRNFLLVAAVPLMVGAALSGSRGGTLSAAALCLVVFPLIIKRIGFVRSFVAGVGSAALGAAAWTLMGTAQKDYLYQRFIVQTFERGYTSGRDQLAAYAWELGAQNPLGGAGIGTFAATFEPGVSGLHAHNLFLSTLVEGGTVGVLLLALALLAPVYVTLRSKSGPEVTFLLISGLFILMTSMFSGDYYDGRFIWFYLVLAEVWSSKAVSRQDDGLDPRVVTAAAVGALSEPSNLRESRR